MYLSVRMDSTGCAALIHISESAMCAHMCCVARWRLHSVWGKRYLLLQNSSGLWGVSTAWGMVACLADGGSRSGSWLSGLAVGKYGVHLDVIFRKLNGYVYTRLGGNSSNVGIRLLLRPMP